MPALHPSSVMEEVPVNVGNVFVMIATAQTFTDSFVNVMTAHVIAHYQALCVADMASVSVAIVNVMQDGQVPHVTVGMM